MGGLELGTLSLHQAQELVEEWIGRKPSDTAISNWRALHRLEWRLGKAKAAGDVAMAEAPADLEEKARLAIGYQRMVAVLGQLSPDEIVAFERNELTREKQDLERQKLELDREKFDAAQAKEAAAKDTLESTELSPEEKTRRLKEVFGLR